MEASRPGSLKEVKRSLLSTLSCLSSSQTSYKQYTFTIDLNSARRRRGRRLWFRQWKSTLRLPPSSQGLLLAEPHVPQEGRHCPAAKSLVAALTELCAYAQSHVVMVSRNGAHMICAMSRNDALQERSMVVNTVPYSAQKSQKTRTVKCLI